jgi:hypothetical protein
MIAFASPLPFLRIGREIEMADYDEEWLNGIVSSAASRAGHGDWWMAEDVSRSVLLYLTYRFDENVITLEVLREKLGIALRALGFPEIDRALKMEPPPRRLSLVEVAHRASKGYELLFFRLLEEEIGFLAKAGVSKVRIVGLRDAARLVCASRRWNRKCEALAAEVREFVRGYGSPASSVDVQLA